MEPTMFEGPTTLLKASWALFSNSWKKLIPIILVPILCLTVGPLLIVSHLVLIGILLEVLGIISAIAMQAAMIDAVGKLSADIHAPITFASEYRVGFSMFWSVILLAIMQGLITLGSTVLLVIPGIFVAICTTFYLYARVLDGHTGFAAFTESYRLVRGRWWGTLGRFLALVLIYIIAEIIISIIGAIFAAILGAHTPAAVTVSLVLHFALSVSMGAFAVVYLYKMYSSLKASVQEARDVSTFKGWLVAFLVIGIIVIILLPFISLIGLIAIVHNSFRDIPHGYLPTNGTGVPMLGSSTLPQNY